MFSGDKLLGGPQAGLVLGRSDLVDRLRRHPIARAVRVDKMQVAALESVLAAHAADRRDEIPVWRMLRESPEEVRQRADALAVALDGELEGAHVVPCDSAVGGGSLPGYTIPSFGVEVRAPDPNAPGRAPAHRLAARRSAASPIAASCSTSAPFAATSCADLSRAIQYARESDDLDDE